MRILLMIAAFSSAAPTAFGQAFNLDIGPTGSPVPAPNYGGVASQPGFWNALSGSSTLRTLDGTVTSVTAATSTSLGSLSIPGAMPGDQELMESMLFGDRNSTTQVAVIGLGAGEYRLFLYAWSPPDTPNRTKSRIAIDETTSSHLSVVETNFNNVWGGQALGVSYATTDVEVTQAGGLLLFTLLSLGNGEESPVSVLNGIQIVPIPAPGMSCVFAAGASICLRRRRAL